MSALSEMQEQIRQLTQKTLELGQKIQNQEQTITFLWIAVGILAVISFVSLGIALWKNRK